MLRSRPVPLSILCSLSLCLSAVGTTGAAAAPPPGGVADSALGSRLVGVKIVRRGAIKGLATQQVPVGGGRTATIGALAAGLFADQDALTADLRKGRAALFADPVEADEVVETDDATILVKSTTVVVNDPAQLAAASARFGQYRARTTAPDLSELTGASRAEFDAWKASLATLPAGHPLRREAAKGDAALLAAVGAGVGELEITTAVVVPKRDLEVVNGVVQLPTVGDDRIDFTRTRAQRLRFGAGKDLAAEPTPAPVVDEHGKLTHRASFLTGYTVGDGFEWSRKWNFPSGYFKLTANAYYAVGLRAPVEFKAVMTPKAIDVTGASDKKVRYDVELTAQTLDGNADYYRETGLGAGEIHDGKELVLEAGFHLGVHFKAGWGVIKLDKRVGADFDHGSDFRPPFGDRCSQSGGGCGVAVWIPAEVTRTSVPIGIPGLNITGSAQAGFLLAGTGEARVQYSSLYATDAVKSRRARDKDDKLRHNLVFDGDKAITMVTPLDPLGRPGSRRFGFELSEPSYRWKLELIPGVRASIDIKAGKWVDRRFVVGELWLNAAGVQLGNLDLPRHRGTRGRCAYKEGTRTWAK